ncbi:MAG: AEC family transporter, partial [Opitutales bacterium]
FFSMPTSSLIFTATLPVFVVIGAGFTARRIGWLNDVADRSLMSVVVNLLYPALIFSFILDNHALRQPANLIFPPLVGFTSVVAGFGVALFVARRFRIGDPRDCRTFGFATGLYNFGYFPIPIIAALFSRETTGVLLVHNIGVEAAMWAIGVGFILSPNDGKPIWKRIFSGPVIAILVAVPLNLFGIGKQLPTAALESIDLLGRCAIPLGLLLIGATFADLAKGSKSFDRLRIAGFAVALRMGIFPVLFIAAAILLPFSQELKHVIIVQAAMPCAVFPIVLTRHFDGAPDIALKIVLGTTLVSLITIPLWISVGLWFL